MGREHAAGTAKYATKLLENVETLDQKVPTLPLAATQLINGSVALLNEITNVKITGEEDRYSHTDLSDFAGNLTGARRAFQYVRVPLNTRAATRPCTTRSNDSCRRCRTS